MKDFKTFIQEATDGPPSAEDRVRERNTRDKGALKVRQTRELERAREQDFRKKEADRKAVEIKKNAERLKESDADVINDPDAEAVNEYVEDGTDEAVAAYRKATPGI
jgi:hypothetical protein